MNDKNVKNNKKAEREGLVKTMNNGQKATLVTYRSAHDVDVRFEDETLVTNKSYWNFCIGEISNPNLGEARLVCAAAKHEGEVKMMNNGQKATLVKWRAHNDIDVRFEDNTLVPNKRYDAFCRGAIANPNFRTNWITKSNNAAAKHEGETKTMKNGQKATLVKWRGAMDIDVRFEDNALVTNKCYSSFRQGVIGNPNFSYNSYKGGAATVNKKAAEQHEGESRIMSNGQKATLVKWRGTEDVDILFEDDTLVCNKRYKHFLSGHVRNPNKRHGNVSKAATKHEGETRTMHNGQKATITKWRAHNDIDVTFEDGFVATNKRYEVFCRGHIRNTNFRSNGTTKSDNAADRHEGEVRIMNNGQKATLVKWRGTEDVDILFEDDTLVCNKRYQHFLSGYIRNPNFKKQKEESNQQERNNIKHQEHEGEVKMMNNGQKATLVKWRSAKDIDVRFEDNTLVTNKRYSSFRKGVIGNPNFSHNSYKGGAATHNKKAAAKHEGEAKMMNNGQKATLVKWRSTEDVDILFEDDTLVCNKRYKHFLSGAIRNPNKRHGTVSKAATKVSKTATKVSKAATKHEGETRTMHNGQKATLVKWRAHDDIDVTFEDGFVATNKRYDVFCRGYIRNPNFKK